MVSVRLTEVLPVGEKRKNISRQQCSCKRNNLDRTKAASRQIGIATIGIDKELNQAVHSVRDCNGGGEDVHAPIGA
jgi:hypothetical protein